ncbi:sentrin-specific protease 7b isoform X2 [Lates calcarifer]|nr:sentrin-specific protease 7b isoform X2 [Lates calcarifer]
MASPFKIPKKKQPAGSDSAPLHLQSPLSRLQSPASQVKGYGDQSSRRGADRVHAGNSLGSPTHRQSATCKPLFRDVVKTLLGLNSPDRGGASAANHRSPGSWRSQSQAGERAESSSASNGWRPKRASDRLLRPEVTSECLSPPQKKKSDESSGSSSGTRSISVESVDSLAKLRGEVHAGSRSPPTLGARTWRRVEPGGDTTRRDAAEGKSDADKSPEKKNSCLSGSDQTSDDDFVSPSRTLGRRPSSSSSSVSAVMSPGTTPGRRRSLDRTAWIAASSHLNEDVREQERRRWREFRERKTRTLQPRPKRPRQSPAEPIVLSSEEEEEEGDGAKRTSLSSRRAEEPRPGNSGQKQGLQTRNQVCSSRAEPGLDQPRTPPPPSFLQLEFTSLHAGLTHADADGDVLITENGITVPLKVSGAEELDVTVVASQLRGYGVWDGGVAQGGALLAGREGPAPSLLFLWVTDAQANLLHRELSAGRSSASSGPPCSFLLLVLKEQLQELQAALLASILDMDEYKKGRSSSSSSSSSSGLTSPLDWTDGLLLLHSCPPPLDQHLLQLLGHSAKPSEVRNSQRKKSGLNSSGLQQLPARLIQYPAAPCKGRISVTKEDLACLSDGEFLNDVIIDFYLKYLLLEGVGGAVAERSHVFSSFFYKQLSRRRAAGEDDAPSVPDRHMRHQRVKTWTRHVDIFTKDFLFVPVNQEAHWYLVVVCFPGLEESQYEDFERRTGGSEQTTGNTNFSLRTQQPPECTQQGWQRDTVMKRPCILVMDSLKLSYHENVCRLLRDYLQVEWEVRRRTPRLFTSDNMRSSNCRVPQQDNSSDCGLYLLQYVESFLQ